MFSRTPIAASETTRFEPPALINGSALPAKGRTLTITAMLMNASEAIHKTIPDAIKAPS